MKISKTNTQDLIDKAIILSKALPFMQRYSGKNITVKLGGAVMGEKNLSSSFAKDIVLLKQVGINPVVVHGGGKAISAAMQESGLEAKFVGGQRITTDEAMEIVEKTLSRKINPDLLRRSRGYSS